MCLLAALDAGLDTDDAGGVRQSQLAREAAVARQPVDLAHDAGGALLDAAVALVVLGVGVKWRPIGTPA